MRIGRAFVKALAIVLVGILILILDTICTMCLEDMGIPHNAASNITTVIFLFTGIFAWFLVDEFN